ncbi:MULTISPECIES: DUF3347 domain-containing protein [unclassified Mucilaginibacter]|uniref:DUF3347 domain-containing protein n=1 Tax=unclassified Mucilaginibacter TaxID=2617802 RepID=UPI002AC9BB58|nr:MULTISPECIES: DUF3347 domain-containing protein [unclassified Mucilaginibacter]MEB0248547.1 DUF3347 domain-containing protein [Mucilaginibacter sp. 5B2]MEB0262815.1 DUF3347 domain-containing protein [Mucilaginibacter sp. 10I4]MEB0278198.1 DUF3347 domain-containing protein [Mucilaginibacter sp. 10B2]MEB0302080.1 DUF3347 domain-containing protein [Mucilaginibacter sp. 5C4]WPX23844.1 DUF3347 domain-containing protein [Mucilaginibacter sp. 5C4]
MKNLIIVVAFAATSLTIAACNNSNKPAASSTTDTNKMASATGKQAAQTAPASAVKGILDNYLQLKNALAADNSEDAATAGKAIAAGFAKFDQSALTITQKKSFADIQGDAKEMAEHIGESAGKLPHQREHFEMLSQDMVDLVKLFGAGQPLYVDHCPMYNNNKGADWLSETKAIKNPYLGTKMPTCGSVKEELK